MSLNGKTIEADKNNLKIEISDKILLIRGQYVMTDRDLAELYGVETKRLNEQVRRNIERFPLNFMFQLNENEFEFLRSQLRPQKQKPEAVVNIYLMSLPSRGLQCFLLF